MFDDKPVIPSWVPMISIVAIAVLMLSACASEAPLPPPDLGPRLTYSWAADLQLPPRLGTRERLRSFDRSIRTSVDEELMRRGYQQIASGSTDMVVLYQVFLEDKDPRSLLDYADYRSRGGEGSATQVLGGYTEGTLVIEILDGFSLQPIWQSSATAIPDPNGRGERLPAIVRQIMAPLPTR